ncbi:branched-chain alpha-ketoacid dehydrogenase [Linnemannia elongata]|uniref:Protein-serine/threonine kinase n=1 Tax=Linnemannia elongata AG-77 TaxID=1314771 RepID=A0A197JP55_9FUNG|nr:branched-chain alpha-ketoacid dehydrogenase [Linnemannia elongata]KAK5816791.1 branched-chain alpha-ketoacid dehydrogenase kinase [Linnemannia elongata]OAQ26748.1 alpha-ketoacid dehydrogenase kinase [Linnemannia elongata AG-77]
MNQTKAALHALPSGLINRLCRSKATRLSLKQMYTLGRHVLESKSQGALAIPAVFLHQELPIRLSHALKMLNSNSLPINMTDMPNFQSIFASYLEDISMITQMPKPSTPQLEEEFTILLRNLEQRHKIKILAISKGFRELMDNIQRQCIENDPACNNSLFYHNGKGWTIDPQADRAIQTFFNRFYTINLGTRLLIGEHLALHDRGLNLVQRVNPLAISKRAIRDAQKVCAAHYGQSAPSVLIHTPNPDISTTYVDEFLHRNIYELLKNAMRATSETHLNNGSPISLGLSSPTASRSKLPPVKLVLVDGGEDVTIKISDEGGGMALSEMDKIWSYVHSGDSSSLRQSSSSSSSNTVANTQQKVPKTTTTTTPFQPSAPNTSALLTSEVSSTKTESRNVLRTADSMTVMGGLASEAKDYLDLPLNGSGHGLPLARLIARYFGGDLSLISMEGYGTDSYLSLFRDDDHLENFPEVDEEMAVEIDVFINEFMDEPSSSSLSSQAGYEYMNNLEQQQQRPSSSTSPRK